MATVLIVDDSPTLMDAHKRMLENHHHTVITASDGEEGINIALAQNPDLILMDVVMPRMNGFQATRKLSRDPQTRHIPIIMVTSKDQETDILWGKRQGAKDYLIKPIAEPTLISTVQRLLSEIALDRAALPV
ncbi:MAG: response regulator [Oceanospirillaceae bacterium]|nr:response regulator [Oceanospirillaceae bacterium]MCP5335523.1 response regulator [Oceanospirillaceae bacterium]MCP5349994.1 response regulator [Oceanospirillaceae bacterium]